MIPSSGSNYIDLSNCDILQAVTQFQNSVISPETLLEWHLTRIDHLEPSLNCFVTLDKAGALESATESTNRYRAGQPRSVLEGIPIALKDNINVAGLPTSNGIASLRMPKNDAKVTARLKNAGAIVVGKLNMDECALGGTTKNPHHGATQNPWRQGFTPGGSSGGSGAAVSANLVMAALGTDTLGSVRLPAAYCGVPGLKPTKNFINLQGIEPLCGSLDEVGPIGRSICDIVCMMSVLAEDRICAFDTEALSEIEVPKGLRIGVLEQIQEAHCTEEVITGFNSAVKEMVELSAALIDVSLPELNFTSLRRNCLLIIEAEGAEALANSLKFNPTDFSTTLKSMLEFGRNAPASRLNAAKRDIAKLSSSIRHLFEKVDILALPTAPQTAFSFNDSVPENQADFTALASITGFPAIAIPCGISPTGLPLSLQLITRNSQDMGLLKLCRALEKIWGRFIPK